MPSQEYRRPVAVIIDWYGPYPTLDRLDREAKEKFRKGDKILYFATSGNGDKEAVSYVGETLNAPARGFKKHGNLAPEEDRLSNFYIGEIVTSGIPGRRRSHKPYDLKFAEKALIKNLDPELNTQEKLTNPDRCVSVISRFFGKNNSWKPRERPPYFPAVISYNSHNDEWYSAQTLSD